MPKTDYCSFAMLGLRLFQNREIAELLPKIHAAEQVLETGITAPRVVGGTYLEINDRVGMLRVSLLQQGNTLVLLVRAQVGGQKH